MTRPTSLVAFRDLRVGERFMFAAPVAAGDNAPVCRKVDAHRFTCEHRKEDRTVMFEAEGFIDVAVLPVDEVTH